MPFKMDKELSDPPLLDYDLEGLGEDTGVGFREVEIREQDRYLPIANIARIMKRVLPGNAKIAKDAKESIQACVSEYISFITSEASDKCQLEKRKTINGDDLLWAMGTLGFEQYGEPLRIYLAKYRESVKGERPEKGKMSVCKAEGGLGMPPGVKIARHGLDATPGLPGLADPLYDSADFPSNFDLTAPLVDSSSGGLGGSSRDNSSPGQKRARSGSSIGSASSRARHHTGAPEPAFDEKSGLYVTPAYTATDENGVTLQYPSVTSDAEGNIVAVTSEEQRYYDKDSGLSYAYHTQYQLDESGQVDYTKPMVVIPLALNGTREGTDSGILVNPESEGTGAPSSSSFLSSSMSSSEATKTDLFKTGTAFVMQPDGMIGVLNSNDYVGSLEINGKTIDGVEGVGTSVLVNLVSGVVAEQEQQITPTTGQAGITVEVKIGVNAETAVAAGQKK
jgi:nuclear transcription Y subunit beta